MLFHEKLAFSYFQKLFERKKKSLNDSLGDAYHRLNAHEQRQIRQIKYRAMWYAGLFGTLGVIFLYLPVHLKPDLFPSFQLNLPWVGKVAFSWFYVVYMIFLALLEIYALTWLNLLVVHAIARVCRFPNRESSDYDNHIQVLFEVSLDKNSKLQKKLGINPFAGLSPARIFVASSLFILKATLSNLVFKFLLKRMLSRFAVVGYAYYLDYASILVFAAWNMYATHLIVKEAKVRVMGPSLINQLVQRLHYSMKDSEVFRNMVLEILQFIAIAKRNYHHNHYLLANEIIQVFELPKMNEVQMELDTLLSRVKATDLEVQQSIAKLFVLGLLVDGDVSSREVRLTKQLRREGIWGLTTAQLRQWERDYMTGKGLDTLFQKGVPVAA